MGRPQDRSMKLKIHFHIYHLILMLSRQMIEGLSAPVVYHTYVQIH